MGIKLDENLPKSLRPRPESLGHDVGDVPSEGLAGRDDKAVWQAAQESGRFLLTQDLDFPDLRAFALGSHCGILVVRLAEPGQMALLNKHEAAFRDEDVETWNGCFVVLTEHKLRVRRP